MYPTCPSKAVESKPLWPVSKPAGERSDTLVWFGMVSKLMTTAAAIEGKNDEDD